MNTFQVDRAALNTLAEVIRTRPQEYTAGEEEFIKRGRDFVGMYSSGEADTYDLKNPDPKVKIEGVHIDGDNFGAVMAVAVIDTDAATCLMYEYRKDSREALAARMDKGIVEAAVSNLNDHCQLYLNVRNLGIPGLSNREWRVKGVWEACDDGTYFLTYEDTDELNEQYPVKVGNVVASSRAAWLFEPLPKVGNISQTRVTLVARADIKCGISGFIMDRLILGFGKNLSLLRERFDRSLDIDAEKRSTIIGLMRSLEGFSDKDFSHYFQNRRDWVRICRLVLLLAFKNIIIF